VNSGQGTLEQPPLLAGACLALFAQPLQGQAVFPERDTGAGQVPTRHFQVVLALLPLALGIGEGAEAQVPWHGQ